MTPEEKQNEVAARIERRREKIRGKVSRIIGDKFALGMVPIAMGIKQRAEEVEKHPHLAKEIGLDPGYRMAVKQMVDFVLPAKSQVELSGAVAGGLTAETIAKLKREVAEPAGETGAPVADSVSE